MAKQTESGIPFGPCAFNALKFSVLGQDRKNFPDGVFDKKLHDYLKKHLPQVHYLYCNYDEDRRWIQVEGVDEAREGLGIAGVMIYDELAQHHLALPKPQVSGG